jgi:hypothetical protein
LIENEEVLFRKLEPVFDSVDSVQARCRFGGVKRGSRRGENGKYTYHSVSDSVPVPYPLTVNVRPAWAVWDRPVKCSRVGLLPS